MFISRRFLKLSTIALALAACDGATEPGADPIDVQFAITKEVQGQAAEGILPFTPQVTIRPSQIDIFGNIRTPNPCSTLSSRVRQSGNTIEMIVVAERGASAICAQVITVRDYSASLRNVKPGRYTLRVIHQYDELQRDPDVVYEQSIVVP